MAATVQISVATGVEQRYGEDGGQRRVCGPGGRLMGARAALSVFNQQHLVTLGRVCVCVCVGGGVGRGGGQETGVRYVTSEKKERQSVSFVCFARPLLPRWVVCFTM